ncbi:hypothetical protein PHYPSEUDO_008562 [Phytophthora pseudosyringae]|uniref:Uncharacterized protein n=1 Tax=Phytophthora pseudosyringae TaxID=221518 RepID=A0A8T1VDQ9_9STRA|nr:hypothetical protein PHYPSEUDO_008562 [Phytophthora pseudosyringae]
MHALQLKWDAIIMPSLRRHYELHGHTDVNFRFVVPSGDGTWPQAAWGHPLGSTVNTIRRMGCYDTQVEESEEELERLDFCYKTTIVEREWTEKILPRPKVAMKRVGVNSGMVVISIRMREGYIEQVARDKDRLEAIGFAWNHAGEMWNGRIMPTIEIFGVMYPHHSVPQKFVVPSEEPWPRGAWTLKLGRILHGMRSSGSYFSFYGRDIEKLDELGVNVKLSARAWQTRVAPLLDIYSTTSKAREVPEDFVIPSKEPWSQEVWGVRLGLIVARNSHYLPRRV